MTRNQNAGEGGAVKFELDGKEMSVNPPYRHVLESVGAEVLIKDQYGNPFFTVNTYGKGKVYLINAPIETIASMSPGAIVDGKQIPYILRHDLYKLYKLLGIKNKDKIASNENPSIGVTEHIVADDERIINVLNHCPYEQTAQITLEGGFKYDSIISASLESTATAMDGGVTITLPANTGAAVVVKR